MPPLELMEEGLLVTTLTPQWIFRITAAGTTILLATAGLWIAFRLIKRHIRRVSRTI